MPKTSSPNIRVIKLFPLTKEQENELLAKMKRMRFPIFSKPLRDESLYRFFITIGYVSKFGFDKVPAMNIDFCPYCGVNLFKFYKKDEYVHEFEGVDFPSIYGDSK
jgi:hypothetical protein